MPRLGIGMPLVSTATEAPVLAVQDFFWLNDISGELTPIHTASRTNLIPNTSASGMTGSGTTISSSIGPDGTNNGIKMTETTATSQHFKGFADIPVVAGVTYAVSYYIKKGTYNSVAIYTNTAQLNSNATINFANETVTVAGVGIISNSDFILDEGNGWYRVGYSLVAAGTGVTTIYTAPKDLSSYEGSTDNYTEFFGPQLEQDSRASAHIPTSGSAVTVTTTLNDTHNAWDYDSANLMLEEDPDSEGGWQRPSNTILNHDFADLGAEKVTNGEFTGITQAESTTGSEWVTEAGWTISDGKAHANLSGWNSVKQTIGTFAVGTLVRISYEITNWSAGVIKTTVGGVATTVLSDLVNGIKTEMITVANSSDSRCDFRSSNFVGSIDNVSVKEVDPNDRWSLDSNWSIANGKATSTGSGRMLQPISFLESNVGTVVQVTFDIVERTSGGVVVNCYGGVSSLFSTVGTHSFITTTTNVTNLYFNNSGAGNLVGSIDNITVNEYAAMPLDV